MFRELTDPDPDLGLSGPDPVFFQIRGSFMLAYIIGCMCTHLNIHVALMYRVIF